MTKTLPQPVSGKNLFPWLRNVELLFLRRERLAAMKDRLGGNATAERYPHLFRRIEEVERSIAATMTGAIISTNRIAYLYSLMDDEPQTYSPPSSRPLTFLQKQNTLWAKVSEWEHVAMNGASYDTNSGAAYDPPEDAHSRLWVMRQYWWSLYVSLMKSDHQFREPSDQSQYFSLPVDRQYPRNAHVERVNECAAVLQVIDTEMEVLCPGQPHYRVRRKLTFTR